MKRHLTTLPLRVEPTMSGTELPRGFILIVRSFQKTSKMREKLKVSVLTAQWDKDNAFLNFV